MIQNGVHRCISNDNKSSNINDTSSNIENHPQIDREFDFGENIENESADQADNIRKTQEDARKVNALISLQILENNSSLFLESAHHIIGFLFK